jgi:hypothetical protein
MWKSKMETEVGRRSEQGSGKYISEEGGGGEKKKWKWK